MEATALRRPPSLPALIQLGLLASLVVAAGVAWAVTSDRMQGMDGGPGTDLGALGWFVGVWVTMMAAMMFPAIAPMVVMYSRIQEGRRRRGGATAAGATAVFVAGYLVAWSAAGLLGYAIFEAVRSLDIGFLAWDEGGRYLTGGVLMAAAVYQLTPLKDICLTKCRSPFTFLLHRWRPGRLGALRMGIDHGAWCVGCCWALMASLFALGVMSIGWMALIAGFIAVEKMLPWKALANRGVAVALLALAIGILAAPERVPGLTVPGSADAHHAMEAMGMEQDGVEMGPGHDATGVDRGHGAMGAGEGAMGMESGGGMDR